MKLENFTKPIESSSIEEHEHILDDKLMAIQLEYVDRLFSNKIKPLDENSVVDNFSDLISQYTEIPSKLKFSFYKRTGTEEDQKDCEIFQQKVLDGIYNLYKNDYEHWIEKTQKLIKDELESLGPIQEKKDEEKKQQAGLINFGVESNSERSQSFKELKDFGINEGDPYLSIHLEDFYKQKEPGVQNLFSSNSLEKLALKIIDEHSEVKAIVGNSWLMSTPIAKRIGFETLTDSSNKKLAGQFWGQFISSKGQIDFGRVSKFLETGNPPYEVSVGIMKTEDFLRKYLPLERRGKIILKEIKPGFEEEITRENETLINIFADLNMVSEEGIDKIVSSCELLGGFSKSERGKGFVEDIKDLKRNGQTIEDIKKNMPFKKYQEPFREYIKNIKFIDKEVVI